jgi:hypothetical protein
MALLLSVTALKAPIDVFFSWLIHRPRASCVPIWLIAKHSAQELYAWFIQHDNSFIE